MRKLMLSAICLLFALAGESGRSVVSFGPGEAGFRIIKEWHSNLSGGVYATGAMRHCRPNGPPHFADDSGDQELAKKYELVAGLLSQPSPTGWAPESPPENLRLPDFRPDRRAHRQHRGATVKSPFPLRDQARKAPQTHKPLKIIRHEMRDFETESNCCSMTIPPQRFAAKCWNISETCPACAEFYRQTKAAFNTVAPRVEVKVPAGLESPHSEKPPHKPKIRRQPHERPLRHGLGNCGSGRCPRR